MAAYAPTPYAHDLRLAPSETGDRSNAPSPESKRGNAKTVAERRRREGEGASKRVSASISTTSSPSSSSSSRSPDALDLAISYLKKRDGIDKVLKILRYTAKFLLAANQSRKVVAVSSSSYPSPAFAASSSSPSSFSTSFSSPTPPPPTTLALLRLEEEPLRRLKAFESAVGDARKAYRLGKFLQGLDAARRAAPGALRLQPAGVLAFLAAAGDGCYYFLDQFTFFVRAGVIHKSYAPRLARATAVCELVGYFGSASLHAAAIAACAQREAELVKMLRGARKLDLLTDCRGGDDEDDGDEGDEEEDDDEDETERRRRRQRNTTTNEATAASLVERELSALSAQRRARERGLAQDACDALLALSDLNETVASNPRVLALAGLTSALLGAKKVWG